ncbi:acyl-CoA dehydrogenase family protein [Paraburkholderia sp. BR10937]|uniref:acyl-CoA dehydrogenase family protein n=1 Tax=Paraburkholderia sp. BR10937 TaxID=3236994 RepID=UPI0034D1E4BE
MNEVPLTEENSLVLNAAERIFADLADPQTILQIGSDDWKAPLWQALNEMGLPQAWLPEASGGYGLSLAEGFAVVRAAGRAALAIPLVDTMAAGWIAGQAGLSLPSGAAVVIVVGSRASVELDGTAKLSLHAMHVPFAREAQSFVVVVDDGEAARVAVVPASACEIVAGTNLAGDAADDVRIVSEAHASARVPGLSAERCLALIATCRALQIAGALQAVLDISVAYAKERVAFEKTISKFQVVQQNLARLADEVAAAVAVSESAADALTQSGLSAAQRLLEVASARVRCAEAAETGSRIAHQVLGAIGFTEEHILHRFTLRVLSWRDDYGSEAVWARRLGALVTRGTGTDLWHLLAAR